MKRRLQPFIALCCPLTLALMGNRVTAAPFGDTALQSIDGQCDATIARTTYQNRPAYKLSNGAVEAVVVPSIGRVMRWGKIGGPNLLWNNDPSKITETGWKNYGGDKTWLSPQIYWDTFHRRTPGWPPEEVFDGQPHQAEVLTDGKLRLTTGLAKTGIRLMRTMYFDDNGEFVIEQTARKESGAPIKAGLWSVSQAVPGQAVFVTINPDNPYKNDVFRFQGKTGHKAELARPTLMKITPDPTGGATKFGFDTKIAALVSVRDGVAWRQKTPRPGIHYPDGAASFGFPVEVFVNGAPDAYYEELEMLGPLRDFYKGTSWTHTVRWSLHDLPSTDVDAPAVVEAVDKLLRGN